MTSNRMTKAQLISVLAEKADMKKTDIKNLLQLILSLAEEELLSGKDFVIPGLIKFSVVKKAATKARTGVNPFNGKKMIITAKPESKKVRGSIARSLKKLIK